MQKRITTIFATLTLLIFLSPTALAQLTLADIFSDNMVLQQNQSVPLWGTATPNQTLTITFANQSLTTTANANGAWRTNLNPLTASATPQSLTIKTNTTLTLTNVLIGEVWYASGQSNMGYAMKACAKNLPAVQQIIDTANYPNIRYRAVKSDASETRQSSINDGQSWTIATPQTVPNYSAVAFLFARKLHDELNIPIGIIESAQGGHPIEPFIPTAAFTGHPVLEKERRLGAQQDLQALTQMTGGVSARKTSWLPGAFFNSRIAPVAPFAIRGAIWYQAESNAGKNEDPRFYSQKMKALFRGWRSTWNQPNLPIYYIQLPQHTAPGWTYMRDQQRLALSEPNTGMVVTIDLALDQIHPSNKIDVANRLALWPLALQYNRELNPSGPTYKNFTVKKSHLTVYFDNVPNRLVIGQKQDLKPTRLLKTKIVHGFELADASANWHPATARIAVGAVVCSSPNVPNPVAVRYAWAPIMPTDKPWNLYNTAGLPASPFVSDIKYAPFEHPPVTP